MTLASVKTREEAFDLLDGYAEVRKEEINLRRTRRPLVKSYLLETAPHEHANPSLESIFSKYNCDLKRIDETLFRIYDAKHKKYVGLVEQLIPRHPAIYTIDETRFMDPWVKGLVKSSVALDNLWLSGRAFQELLQTVIKITPEHRYVRLAFQHENFFETEEPRRVNSPSHELSGDEDEINADEVSEESSEETDFSDHGQADDDFVPERRKTTFALMDRLSEIKKRLPQMQELYNPLYSISLLRFPAQGRPGGHDFYFNGKVTNRSDSFTDHRLHLQFVLRLYKQATEATELVAWQGVERNNITTGSHQQTFVGAPVVLRFSEPGLSQEVFNNFIESTFNHAHNRFRLWGNPIVLGPRKVHVYGVDRHLWQQIFLEITDKQIVALIPEGTCGNSVHRLVTNVQQYLDPGVRVWVGEKEYSELIRVRSDIRSIYDGI